MTTTDPQPDADPASVPDAVETPAAAVGGGDVRSSLERISAVIADLNIDPASLKRAPRDIQLSLVGAVGFLVASCFEWWSGFARVRGIVNYSATGSGNAYSDWRGWCAVALCVAVAVLSGWELAQGSTAATRKAAAISAVAALGFTLWFWAAYSAGAAMSDGLGVEFGASFGLYLGLAATITATVGSVRRYREGSEDAPAADTSETDTERE